MKAFLSDTEGLVGVTCAVPDMTSCTTEMGPAVSPTRDPNVMFVTYSG